MLWAEEWPLSYGMTDWAISKNCNRVGLSCGTRSSLNCWHWPLATDLSAYCNALREHWTSAQLRSRRSKTNATQLSQPNWLIAAAILGFWNTRHRNRFELIDQLQQVINELQSSDATLESWSAPNDWIGIDWRDCSECSLESIDSSCSCCNCCNCCNCCIWCNWSTLSTLWPFNEWSVNTTDCFNSSIESRCKIEPIKPFRIRIRFIINNCILLNN